MTDPSPPIPGWRVDPINYLSNYPAAVPSSASKQPKSSVQIALKLMQSHDRYLSTLVEVKHQLLACQDIQECYTTILEPLGQVSGASRVYILKAQPDLATPLAECRVAEWCADNLPVSLRASDVSMSYRKTVPYWAETLHQGGTVSSIRGNQPSPEYHLLVSQDILAILLLPLMVRGRFYGLIGFDNCVQAHAWDFTEINLLNRAAIALSLRIEHLLTQNDLEQQAQRGQVLNHILRVIRTSLNLPTVFLTVSAEINQLLQATQTEFIRYLPDQGRWLHLADCHPPASGLSTAVDSALASPDWIVAQLQNHQLVRLNRTNLDEADFPIYPDSCNEQWLIPIMIGTSLWGCLSIVRPMHSPVWQSWEVDLARTVADQLAIAIQQSELFQRVQQLNHCLEEEARKQTAQLQKALNFEALLKRITDRVRDSLDEAQILQTAVQELALGLGVHSCDTGLYDLEQKNSVIAYEYLQGTEITPAKGIVFQMADYPEVYSQLLRGQYLQFCWFLPPLGHPRELRQSSTILCCPLINDQGVIGDMWLYDTVDTYFEEAEVRLVQQVANQCAIAIRQARLYQEAQAQVQELERLNYLKDDFLNTVSHELRSPMANIEMAIQMLDLLLFDQELAALPQDGPPDIPELSTSMACALNHNLDEAGAIAISSASLKKAFRYFRMLQDECHRETSLINDLLDLSRLEAGTEPLMLTTIDLSSWVPHVVEPFLERARKQQQQLDVTLPPHLPPMMTDLSSLERILTELLHNACKYTPPQEKITVSVTVESNPMALGESSSQLKRQEPPTAPAPRCSIHLRVTNSGVEIPFVELPRIFDKFYRIPSNDPWKYGGTGLGLALVKKLVNHLGGTIQVESQNQQVTFTVVLPLEETN